MAEKTSANIGFEKQLWDAACVLWGHIPAAEYRKVIIDKFGKDVKVLANDMKSFRAIVTTATGPVFFSWVFGFGSHVSIKAPEDVKGEYARLVLEAAEAIKGTQQNN